MSARNWLALTVAAAAAPALASLPARGQDGDPATRATLEVITVEGRRDPQSSRNSYVLPVASTATRTATPVLETAQAISTITRRQIDDQNPQTVGNALRYTPGVLSDPDATTRYDSVFIRGFGGFGLSTNFVSHLDGLRLPRGQAFAATQIDPFLLDRVEVIRGPSALLYGQISPGGLVNQISRQPSLVPYNELRVETGSHGRLQGGFTSQGPVDADGRLTYSISTIGRMSGTRYDDVEEQRFGIAPALTWRPSADTRLTVSGYYQRDPEGGYFNSLFPRGLAPAAYQPYLNRGLNIGDPTFDRFEREQYGIGYSLDHRFNPVVSIHSSLRYSGVDTDMQSLQMAGAITSTGLIPRQAVGSLESVTGVSTDNHVRFEFDTLGIGHTLITGIDYQNSRSSWVYRFGGASALDVVRPSYGIPVGPLATFIDNRQELSQTGVYVQEQLRFGGFRLTLGARHDWTEQQTDNRLTQTTSAQDSRRASYRAGLLYQFDNGIAPYVSYSTSFEPVIGVDAAGTPFAPTTAEQYEVGIKYQPSFLNALFTFSAFDIRQQNVLTPGPVVGFNVQQGEVRSRGLEFEARGQVLENLEMIGALTFLETEVTRSTVASVVGNRPQAVPQYFASLWANYRLTTGPLTGLTLGGGVRFVGSSYADDDNTLRTPGYAIVDAALRYDLGTLNTTLRGAEATLNVSNLFDRDYYSSCSSNIYCQFGSGRTVLVGLRYRW